MSTNTPTPRQDQEEEFPKRAMSVQEWLIWAGLYILPIIKFAKVIFMKEYTVPTFLTMGPGVQLTIPTPFTSSGVNIVAVFVFLVLWIFINALRKENIWTYSGLVALWLFLLFSGPVPPA